MRARSASKGGLAGAAGSVPGISVVTRMQTSRSPLWAALLSVGIHGAIGFGLWWMSCYSLQEQVGPVEIDACVVIDDAAGRLYLPTSHSPMQSRDSVGAHKPAEIEEESEPFTATVRSAPARDDSKADLPANEGSTGTTDKAALGSADSNNMRGAGNRNAPTASYGVTASSRSVVFVIDRSLSMGLSGAFRQAKRETAACLAHLPRDAKFQVILYNRRAEPLRVNGSTGLLIAETANVSEVNRRIGDLRAEGGTDHLRALKEAIHLKPDAIFVVTDADGLTQEAVDAATRMNLGQAAIHCIELANGSDDRGSSAFRRLAKANGGTYRLVDVNRKSDERDSK